MNAQTKNSLAVGIIGCGNISEAYMKLAPLFRGIHVVACADISADAAKARADQFGLKAMSVDDILETDEVNIIVNLTIPSAHFDISRRAIESGKHVYSEKPFVLSLDEGEALKKLANEKGVRIGSAPDTFLGGSHQLARRLIDDGKVGRITSGTAHVMSRGMEHWHPNPDFFFLEGAGPVLDIGPYYVTELIQLIGPVKRIMAMSSTPSPERTILSEARRGEKIPVETPTTIHALLEFENGAIVTLGTSWDVREHGHGHIELYGETGTIHLPDPNFFGGDVVVMTNTDERTELEPDNHPFGRENVETGDGRHVANYRTAGLADMATAILENRPHRCSLELALHAVEVMTSILQAGETGEAITLSTSCERPEPLTAEQAAHLFLPEEEAA